MQEYKDEIGRLLEPLVNLTAARITELLEVPPEPQLGDLAFPCFSLAPVLKKSPAAIAEELSRKLSGQRGDFWEKPFPGAVPLIFLDPVAFGRHTLARF